MTIEDKSHFTVGYIYSSEVQDKSQFIVGYVYDGGVESSAGGAALLLGLLK